MVRRRQEARVGEDDKDRQKDRGVYRESFVPRGTLCVRVILVALGIRWGLPVDFMRHRSRWVAMCRVMVW